MKVIITGTTGYVGEGVREMLTTMDYYALFQEAFSIIKRRINKSSAFDEARKDNPRAILGGMDTAMRTCVKSDILTFSVAASMFERMVANMDKSFLTTYIWEPLKKR